MRSKLLVAVMLVVAGCATLPTNAVADTRPTMNARMAGVPVAAMALDSTADGPTPASTSLERGDFAQFNGDLPGAVNGWRDAYAQAGSRGEQCAAVNRILGSSLDPEADVAGLSPEVISQCKQQAVSRAQQRELAALQSTARSARASCMESCEQSAAASCQPDSSVHDAVGAIANLVVDVACIATPNACDSQCGPAIP